MTSNEEATRPWTIRRGDGPFVATAIHDGHGLRDDVVAHMALGEGDRLREEDPFTGVWTAVAPNRVIVTHSRFEVDLNRPRETAVYRTPEQSWGLRVWKGEVPAALVERSLGQYDDFYSAMHDLLSDLSGRYGSFVVFDLHSYNHRREGPSGAAADPKSNPQVNVGTESADRARSGHVIEAFMESLRGHDFPGGPLDVRENVKFKGGHWSRWVHKNFPETGLALAVEFKKFFMDEWTGEPDRALVDAIGDALQSTVEPVLQAMN